MVPISAAKVRCEDAILGFAVVRERRYGATMITILQRQSGETE